MAKTAVIETKVKAEVTEAIENVKKFGESLDDVRKKAGEGGKSAAKDWGGFATLFTGLLPRNVQMMIRKFQSTTRQVGRLSKGLKFLKGAFAGLGIGLLIIALETLIERWDDITRFISGVTKEQERYNDVVKAGANAVEDYNIRNKEYIKTVQDSSKSTEVREQALSELATQLREVQNLDLQNAKDLERFNKAIERQTELVMKQSEQQELLNQINQIRNERDEASIPWWENLGNAQHRQNKLAEIKAEKDDEINGLLEQYNQLTAEKLGLEAETTAELDRQAAQQERLRLLEAARLKYGKDWEFQMQQMEEADEEAFEQDMFRLGEELSAELGAERKKNDAIKKEQLEFSEWLDNLSAEDAAREEYWANEVLRIKLAGIDAEAQARNANFRAAQDISTQLERLSKEGTNAQKAFAVTSVLLSQAETVSSAIAAAVKAAAATGPAAPVVTPLLIAQMVGIALSSFAQVRSILQQAGANVPTGSRGGGARGGSTNALIPQGAGGRQLDLGTPAQAYVVQSQLQGQMHFQSSLEKRLHL